MSKVTKGSNMMWEGSRIMLPEHVQALQSRKVAQKKVPKHSLDEQELQELGFVVMDSLHHELDVSVTYWKDGFYTTLVGVVDKVDFQTKKIKLRIHENFDYITIDSIKEVVRIQ